jgi:hypothetical protein
MSPMNRRSVLVRKKIWNHQPPNSVLLSATAKAILSAIEWANSL